MAEQIKYGHFLHGGDYNPEQWLDRPDILEQDIEYFKKAHINTVSVGIFSWAVLEPEEGKYNFDWLTSIRKFFVWMMTVQDVSSEADTIIALPLRSTEKKCMRWIKDFPKDLANILQYFCGIFPMNSVANAIVRSARQNSENG